MQTTGLRTAFLLTAAITVSAASGCSVFESLLGSDEVSEADAEDEDDGAEADDAKAEADGGTGTTGAPEDNAPDAANAAKDADAKAGARVDCPEALKGKDAADRVLVTACGTVKVEGDYSMEGGTLTIEPGVKLVFADGAKMTVGYYEASKLVVNGTAESPVVFESEGDKAPGVWKGLRLYKNANRSKIQHLTVRHAGSDDDGAVRIDAGDVEVKGLIIEQARKLGLRVETEIGFSLQGSSIAATEGPAIRVKPASAGGIASDNGFEDDAVVEIPRGSLASSTKLQAISAAWSIPGKLQVNGKDGNETALEIEAGARLRFGPDATLEVGYYEPARLVAKGTADKPIVFEAASGDAAGSWKYVAIHRKGAGTFEHVEFKGGGDDKRGTLYANGEAKVSVDHVTFTNSDPAVVFDGDKLELEKLTNTKFSGAAHPIRTNPKVFGGVGEGNTYDEGARIHLTAGTVDEEATWTRQDALVELDGKLQVDNEGALTVQAGSRFVVEDGVTISVGYYDRGSLALAGTAEAPITFVGIREEPGVWGPITINRKARSSKIEHTAISHAKGDAAVVVSGEGALVVDTLTCSDCEGKTLSWTCKGEVEAKGVDAAVEPSGCK